MATVEAPPQISTQHTTSFQNEPMVDFSRPENAQKMKAALEKVRAELGREYELVIGGKRVKTADKIKSLNPANPSQVVGVFQKAGREHVEPAMEAAQKAFETWSRTSWEERAEFVFKVAKTRSIPTMVTYAGGYAQKVEDTVTIHCNTVAAAKNIYGAVDGDRG